MAGKEETTIDVLKYAIPGNDEGGRLFLYGNKAAKYVLFFCAGFPCDSHTFRSFAQTFVTKSSEYLCGVTCLPGYDDDDDNDITNNPFFFKPEGYTFDEMVGTLREAVKVLRSYSTNPKHQLTGIFHDWGCMVGNLCANRMNKEDVPEQYFSSLVYFDVLPPFAHPSYSQIKKYTPESWKKTLVMNSYMPLFGVSFAIQRYISHYLAAPFMLGGLIVLGILGLAPKGKHDDAYLRNRKQQKSLRKIIYMAYPYYYMMTNKLFRKKKKGKPLLVDEGGCLPENNVKDDDDNNGDVPVLYMYGADKNIQYHNDSEIEWLKQSQDGKKKTKVVAVEDAGHWLFIHQPQFCFEEVRAFVES